MHLLPSLIIRAAAFAWQSRVGRSRAVHASESRVMGIRAVASERVCSNYRKSFACCKICTNRFARYEID